MSTKKSSKTKPQRQLRKVRVFSEAFKKKKIREYLEHKVTVQQISDLYQVSRAAIYLWIYKYSNIEPGVKTVVQMESEAQKTKYLLNRVAELERIVGQKQLQLDLNEKVFDLLTKELGYDVKKKYEHPLLNGSD